MTTDNMPLLIVFLIGIGVFGYYSTLLMTSHWSNKLSPKEKEQYLEWKEKKNVRR